MTSEPFPTVDLVSAFDTRTDTAPAIAASAVPVVAVPSVFPDTPAPAVLSMSD